MWERQIWLEKNKMYYKVKCTSFTHKTKGDEKESFLNVWDHYVPVLLVYAVCGLLGMNM